MRRSSVTATVLRRRRKIRQFTHVIPRKSGILMNTAVKKNSPWVDRMLCAVGIHSTRTIRTATGFTGTPESPPERKTENA